MVEVSTSLLSCENGKEAEVILGLEKSGTDYFHIDVMDGKFVEKDTYERMKEISSYIKRISNLPIDVHLMVEDVIPSIKDFISETTLSIELASLNMLSPHIVIYYI